MMVCSCGASKYNLLANSDFSSSVTFLFISVLEAIFKSNIVFMAVDSYIDNFKYLALYKVDTENYN